MLAVSGYLALTVTFAAVAISDFRTRSVSVLWLVFAGMSSMYLSVVIDGWMTALCNAVTGVVLLVAVNICCLLCFRIRHGRDAGYIDSAIGLGDIVFLSVCLPLFPYMRFAWMLVASSVLGLIYSMCGRSDSIPLAGIAALVSMAMKYAEMF